MKNGISIGICLSGFCILFLVIGCDELSNKKGRNSGKGIFSNRFSLQEKELGAISGSYSWDYEYNGDGLPSKITSPGGKITELSYSFFAGKPNQIRKIIKKNNDETVSSEFNEAGNPVEMQDKFGTVNIEYDQQIRPVRIKRNSFSDIIYTYNASDQLTGISVRNGYRIEYLYDFLGRISAMKTPAGDISYNYYTGDGIVERVLPNGIRTHYKYMPDGKLESIAHAEKNGNILVKYTYRYNADGLISEIEEWTGKGAKKLEYGYDKAQRLTTFIDGDGSKTSYAYDNFGNRTETEVNGNTTDRFTYDGLGKLTAINNIPSEYDPSGNQLTNNNGAKVFQYNSNNQLLAAGKCSYEYLGDGSLFNRTCNAGKTSFITNQLSEIWQPLVAGDDANNQVYYIWEGNTPVAAVKNGKAEFFLTDHLGSVRSVADANGTITQQLNYSPFGTPRQDIASNNLAPGFTGLFYDPEAKLYITKARAYNPENARFMQVDPLHQTPSGTQKDLSLFVYCGGDPVNFYDKIGLQSSYFNQLNSNILDRYNWTKEYLKALINPMTAKETYAKWSEETLINAKGTGIAAGITATFLDIVGGYIPGKGGNQGQELASVAWSLLSGLNSLNKVSTAIKTIDFSRTISSSAINISQKDYKGAALDLLSISGKIMKIKANNIIDSRYIGINNQLEFYYANPSRLNIVKNLKQTSHYISQVGRFSNAEKVMKVYTNDQLGRNNYSEPSNVGGIYLSGTGKAFEGSGKLTGIAVDETSGKLVLLSEDKGTIDLPALRLDDVVTVFRSVYQFGEAPFVSIDPDPQNPKGPIMRSRHGEATANTYVGWILFEADRVMKAYSLGEDNITKQPVKTGVAGYDKVMETMFSEDAQGPTWERFWIVPSSVTRNNSSDQSLTLLDVPLMVKTQKMVLQNGKLVTAPNGKSSQGAEAFSKWFTDHYDQIAGESLSVPPAESGLTKPVPVFKELQRIAFITAIAEQLRDRGVALPFWMRTYEVKPFPTPETTPTHTVTRQNGAVVHTVFGGVNLSPATDKIFTRPASPVANSITPKIAETARKQSFFVPVKMTVENKTYDVAVLPGNDTKDLAPCVLNETDLSVRVSNGFYLSLTRKYNSFIKPLDQLFGKTWSLDLPFLEEQKIPDKNTGDAVNYRTIWNLISPMNNYTEKFDKVYSDDNKQIGFKTKLISLTDGTNLHFNEKGFLVAYEKMPEMIIYNRDNMNRIIQIVGFLGQKALADIRLEYDKSRVIAAKSSDGESVKYEYSGDGELKQVIHSQKPSFGFIAASDGVVGYDYQNGLVTTIKYNNKTERQFSYNDKAQITGESSPGYSAFEYKVVPGQFGSKVITYTKPEAKKENKPFLSMFELKKEDEKVTTKMEEKEMTEYDQLFRPVLKVYGDGSVARWEYPGKSDVRAKITVPGEGEYHIEQSNDGQELTYTLPNGINYLENYDQSGQLVSLAKNGQVLVQQKWNNIGKLDETVYENTAIGYEYDNNGALKRTLVTPPGKSNSYKEWVEYTYDESGNKTGVSDYSGLKVNYQYDRNGFLSSIQSKQGNMEINRDNNRINSVNTSWGNKLKYIYDQNGDISEINNSDLGNGSYLKFTDGKISKIVGSNGSKYTIKYGSDTQSNQVREIETPVNKLKYNYTDEGYIKNVICDDIYEVAYSYDGSGRIKQIRINAR